MTVVRLGGAADREPALDVWRRSNTARGKAPDPARVARVGEKLADPDSFLIVAGPAVVGMALAEPGWNDPRLCHISMVFVDPGLWGHGLGALLLDGVATEAATRGYTTLQLWTGESNTRAQALYRKAGFTPTGRLERLPSGEPVLHLTRELDRLEVADGRVVAE